MTTLPQFDPKEHPRFIAQITQAVMTRGGKAEGAGEVRFHCPNPSHPDKKPHARWNVDKGKWVCDSRGCHTELGGGATHLAKLLGIALPREPKRASAPTANKAGGGDTPTPVSGATMQPLTAAKRLPLDFVRSLGLSELTYLGAQAVAIPYYGTQPGETIATRFRIALEGPDRFRWKKGDHPQPYGIWRLADAQKAGWVLCVEGETDCWTAWYHGVPCLGVPGKSTWKSDWAAYLAGLDVIIWQEPDAKDFTRRLGATLPGARVIVAPAGTKDISEAHCQGQDVAVLVARLRETATPVADVFACERQDRLAVLKRAAAPVLDEPDPIPLVERAIRALGYGGDVKPPLITYLALTSRLLSQRAGTMPAHLLLTGPASSGKSFTASVALRLLPLEAKAEIDAGSPRVLIYDDTDLRHRVLVFGEADSLPAGEDNPAASAIRTLLQEGSVKYKVVVRDPDTGSYVVKTIERDGPTVLLTTSVKSLGPQLATRLFALDIPDDAPQIRAALAAQGVLEEEGSAAPDADLIAFQSYLQASAPWDVTVPFARRLSELIGETHLATRVLRDFQRLLALVKSVAILRHGQRTRDTKGRLIATIEDYATVRDLVNHLYAATVSGGSLAIRATVAAVETLRATVSQPSGLDVANQLGVHKSTATRRINRAIALGWLVNEENLRGKPYKLALGDPMPVDVGLPAPELLCEGGCTVAGNTGRATPPPSPQSTNGAGTALAETVRSLLALPPVEIAAFRAALDTASPNDPHRAHDEEAWRRFQDVLRYSAVPPAR